jgi:hypothetical protein
MIPTVCANFSRLLKIHQRNGMLAAWAFERRLLADTLVAVKPFGYGFEQII